MLKKILVVCCLLAIASPSFAKEIGDAASEIKIKHWIKGNPTSLAAAKLHTITVLEFWATDSKPCLEAIPQLAAMQTKFKGQVTFIAITNEESKKAVAKFVKKQGAKINYTVAIDDEDQTAIVYMEAFKQNLIPHVFVIDRRGRVAWHGMPLENLDYVLDKMIAGTFDIKKEKKRRQLADEAEKALEEFLQQTADPLETSHKVNADGMKLIEQFRILPKKLNSTAWRLMTRPDIIHCDLEVALKMAQTAAKETDFKQAPILDTYAKALYETGDMMNALEYQQQAIDILKQKPSITRQEKSILKQMEKTLNTYEKKAK